MAVLSDADRIEALRYYIQKAFTELRGRADFDTTALKTAVDATDDWIEANAASFNSALPVGFRTNATAAQKTILFCYVALRRAGIVL